MTATEVDLRNLSKKSKHLVGEAIALGWTARDEVHRVVLRSPVDSSIEVDLYRNGQMNAKKAEGFHRKLLRYADPVKRRQFATRKVKEAEARAGSNGKAPTPKDVRATVTAIGTGDMTQADEPVTAVELDVAEDEVIETYRARGTNGKGNYPSKSVQQIRLGDKIVGYQCSACGYRSDRVRAITGHLSRLHDDAHLAIRVNYDKATSARAAAAAEERPEPTSTMQAALDAIETIVQEATDELQRERDAALREAEQVRAENKAIRDNLAALSDLLKGVTE